MTAVHVQHAQRHVHRLRAFDVHLATFVIVLSGTALLNWIISPSVWWMAFPAIGWGVVLAGHALSVFGDSLPSSARKDRKSPDITVKTPGV